MSFTSTMSNQPYVDPRHIKNGSGLQAEKSDMWHYSHHAFFVAVIVVG